MEASIGEMLVSILVQFQIGEFEYTGENPLHHEPVNLSELPLMEKAEEWGLTVKIVPGLRKCLAITTRIGGKSCWCHRMRRYASMNWLMWRWKGLVTQSPTPSLQWQEIMAELAAVALYQIIMQKPDERLSDSYSHIFLNAVVLDKTPVEACLEVFTETEEIIKSILD